MKKLITMVGITTTLLLGACQAPTFEETDASYLSSEVEDKGYINDTGYSDMYLEVAVLTRSVVELSNYTTDLLGRSLSQPEKDEAIDYYLEMQNTLENLQFDPKTDYDHEMLDSARMYRQNASMVLTNMVKYLQSGDIDRVKIVQSYANDMKVYNRDLIRIMKKYELD